MRKLLLFLSSLLLLLTGCSNEELHKSSSLAANESKSDKVRWYGTKLSNDIQTKGVADGSKRWNTDAGIYIKFLNNPDTLLVEKVKQIASEWEKYAGIKFHFVAQDKLALVRIAFDWNDNDWLTWSYTGIDAKFERDQNQPTAVLAGSEYLSQEEFRGDVLRLFGQILGLEYEQRHQEWSKNGYWKNESALRRYWEAQFEGHAMNWDEIREYVFDPLTNQNTYYLMQTKEIDELSIMAWPYYSRQQTSNIVANYELSEGDKSFIAQLYPSKGLPTIQQAWVDAGYFKWANAAKTALRITELGAKQEYLPDVSDGEQLTSANRMFYIDYYTLVLLKKSPKFNTSNITDFSGMFAGCDSLRSIPDLDTSKGTDFSAMFNNCNSLTSIPDLDTANGKNFGALFSGCGSLTNIPHLDTSKGTVFTNMFSRCSSLTSIPDLDTANGKNFAWMFCACSSLAGIPDLDTANGMSFFAMFKKCSSLTGIPDLDTSKGTRFDQMFVNCFSLRGIPDLDTANGTDFSSMFNGCSSLTGIPLLDTAKGTNFSFMFSRCSSLTGIPGLDTANGTDFSSMFNGCSSLIGIPLLDTSK